MGPWYAVQRERHEHDSGLGHAYCTISQPEGTGDNEGSTAPCSTLQGLTLQVRQVADTSTSTVNHANVIHVRWNRAAAEPLQRLEADVVDEAGEAAIGLNEYGGLPDEDDAAEAAVVAQAPAVAWHLPGESDISSSDEDDVRTFLSLCTYLHI